MRKQLSMLQLALGVLLLIPPVFYLCNTRPNLTKLVNQSQTNTEPILKRLDNLVMVMTNSSSLLNTIGGKSGDIAQLLARIPLPLGPAVPSLRTISVSCSNLADVMSDSASGLQSTSIVVNDTPKVIANVRDTATMVSFVAMLTGIVIILNARQLMLLQAQLNKTRLPHTDDTPHKHGG